MTRKASLVVTVVTALAFAAPALARVDSSEPQWQKALTARSDALNKAYGLGAYDPALRALEIRSQGLNERYGLGAYASSSVNAVEARERAFGAKRDAQLTSTLSPDAFERAVGSHIGSVREPVVDDRFRIDPTTVPGPVTVTTSGRDIEWPQIGIGFGIGLLLAAGLYLATRLSRTRQLVH